MDPEIWGPHAWQFLHSITLSYPDNPTLEDKNNHAQFFNSLKDILPCQKCQDHFTQNLQENPVENYLDNKELLFNWLIDIHNKVNVSNGKKEYSYDEVIKLYENMYKSNDKKSINNWLYIAFIILIILLCIYYFQKYFF